MHRSYYERRIKLWFQARERYNKYINGLIGMVKYATKRSGETM